MLTTMKKLFYILAAVATVSFTACDDLLEEKNYGNPTVEDMMANEENVPLLVGQSYADLKWIHDHWGYWGVSSLTSDECVCPIRLPGKHWNDSGYWKNLNVHTWTEFAECFRNIWNSTISGAVNCNQLIKTLTDNNSKMSEESFKQYIGELEVLRSYYFYLLFDCFGRIPYLEEYVDKTEPLMEPEDVWSHLVACLERNAPNMAVVSDGNRSQNYGRVTQGFAYALLARLYLNAESFGCTETNVFKNVEKPATFSGSFMDNCVRCCDAVINSGSYKIESDFFANFKIDNSASKENIFVLVEDGNAEFDHRYNGSMSNKLRIPILTLHYSHQQTWGMIEKPWNGFSARPEFMALYNENDVRGAGNEYETITDADGAQVTVHKGTRSTKQWGWFVGPVYDAKGEKILLDENKDQSIVRIEIESLDGATWNDGARLWKYEIDKNGAYAYGENDFVLMRYADVLWMKEEAILRGGAGTSGFNSADFTTLKKRTFAYGGTSFEEAYGAAPTLEMILDERGREFAWELIRRRDLIRFGEYEKVQYVSNTNADYRWFPIPYSVLEKSKRDENGNPYWTQNKGY